mmetsp:Transcript_62987/g.203087  ORF Transcript_62987/g.203087 Transcript_62987/m.203087 type:complete len:87 (+) Transcript_62987:918-1178(+)
MVVLPGAAGGTGVVLSAGAVVVLPGAAGESGVVLSAGAEVDQVTFPATGGGADVAVVAAELVASHPRANSWQHQAFLLGDHVLQLA